MTKFFLAMTVVVLGVSTVDAAGPIRTRIQEIRANWNGNSTCDSPSQGQPPIATPAPVTVTVTATMGGTAQQHANTQASRNNCFHPGGFAPGATHEGVGFSSVSADHAIRSCCYWGRMNPVEIGVARGANGWYAAVQYGSAPRPLQTLAQGTMATIGNTIGQTGQVISNFGTRLAAPTCSNGTCPQSTVIILK